MNKETLNKLNAWLKISPESFHTYDLERFHDMLMTAQKHDDLMEIQEMDLQDLVKQNKPDWCDNYITEFTTEWEIRISACVYLLQYLSDLKSGNKNGNNPKMGC